MSHEAAQNPIAPQAPKAHQRSRAEWSALVGVLREDLDAGLSGRRSAEIQDAAHSSLNHALHRVEEAEDCPMAAAFPETPAGIAGLHRLVIVLLGVE